MFIKNSGALASKGNEQGRKAMLELVEAGLQAADPYASVRSMLRIEDGKLLIGDKRFAVGQTARAKLPLAFDLSRIGKVYVFGGGKAVQRIAKAIEDSLGDLVSDGQINVKKGDTLECTRVKVAFAGHPLPDEDGVAGAQRKDKLEEMVKPGDIVFYLSSGGGTATLAWPAPGLALADVQEITRLLYFEKGASMLEKNAVLSKLRFPRNGRVIKGAPLINVSSSETPPGGYLWHRGFPSRDAIDILKRYRLWDQISPKVRAHLERVHDDPAYDAYAIPIHSSFRYEECYSFRAIGPENMLSAVESKARDLGIAAHVLCPSLNDIEASSVAATMAGIARNVESNRQPFRPPCLLVMGGELTVSTGGMNGVGGRCQEFALSTAPWIRGSSAIVAASVDSDGTDGPTDVAGGIVDGYSFDRASKLGINVFHEMDRHNSHEVLTKLDDTITTGALGQNLRSLYMVMIGEQ